MKESRLQNECSTCRMQHRRSEFSYWQINHLTHGVGNKSFHIVRYSSFVHIRGKHVIYTWQVSLFSRDREPHRFEEHLQISPFLLPLLNIVPDFMKKLYFSPKQPIFKKLESVIDQQDGWNLASTAIMSQFNKNSGSFPLIRGEWKQLSQTKSG